MGFLTVSKTSEALWGLHAVSQTSEALWGLHAVSQTSEALWVFYRFVVSDAIWDFSVFGSDGYLLSFVFDRLSIYLSIYLSIA